MLELEVSIRFSRILTPKGHLGQKPDLFEAQSYEVWDLCGCSWADKWLMSDWVSQQAHMAMRAGKVSDDNEWLVHSECINYKM